MCLLCLTEGRPLTSLPSQHQLLARAGSFSLFVRRSVSPELAVYCSMGISSTETPDFSKFPPSKLGLKFFLPSHRLGFEQVLQAACYPVLLVLGSWFILVY